MYDNSLILLSGLLAVASYFGTAAFRLYATRIKLLDIPNHRSSHEEPTPRGGGVVFVALCISSILILQLISGDLPVSHMVLLAFCAIAGVGAIDDLKNVPPWVRLGIQLLCAIGVVLAVGGLVGLRFVGDIQISSGLLGSLVAIVGLVWMMNLYNFMDGVDAIASVEALFIALVAGFFLQQTGNSSLALWMWILASSLLGFLIWNFPPARIFMGDAGSSFLGFFFGSTALISHVNGALDIWFWLILFGVFAVDATITLLYRLMRWESLSQAHRTHAYQHMALKYGSHRIVVLYVMLINIGWLLPFATLCYYYPQYGFILCVLAYLPLMVLAIASGAGRTIDVDED